MSDETKDVVKSKTLIKCLQALFPNKKVEELPFYDITDKKRNPRHQTDHEFFIHLETVCRLYVPRAIWEDYETEFGINSLLNSNNVKNRFNQGETEITLELGRSG